MTFLKKVISDKIKHDIFSVGLDSQGYIMS